MFRSTLQGIAAKRIREARVLLRAREYDGAYYLAGYAVECALKAKIAKGCKRYEFPDMRRAKQVWTHSVKDLVNLAGLTTQLAARLNASPRFKANWGYVVKWGPDERYGQPIARKEAIDLCNGIDDPHDGVLTWIQGYW